MRIDNVVDAAGRAASRIARLAAGHSSRFWRRIPWRPDPTTPGRVVSWRIAAAVVVLIALAPLSAVLFTPSQDQTSANPVAATPAGGSTVEPDPARSSPDRAARGTDRTPAGAETPRATPPTAKPKPKPKPKATTKAPAAPARTGTPAKAKAAAPPAPAKVLPVAWLNQAQMDNAAIIVRTGQKAGLPTRAYVIAVATAMQESTLLNLANPSVPASLLAKSQGMGYDHDSVGLFQQRPSSGWGTPAQLLDPVYASNAFYRALVRVPGYLGLPLTVAAQAVQVSAFPNAYAKHESAAQLVVNALT